MRGNIDERGRKLFIGGLHLKTNEESLKAFYSQWGELIDVVVMRDPTTGKSRGFGFVTYNDPSSVDVAQSNRPHEIDGIKVDAKRAMPKEDTSPEFHATVNRLFVGRLKKNMTAEVLKQYFSEFGTIADAVIINSPAGESRGFGFVTFDDPDSVDKIIVSRPHQVDGQTVEVKKALPRNDNKSSNKSNTTGTKDTRRGGFNSTSFNPRFQETPSKPSFGNYPNSNGNYRNTFNANDSAPYSQSYSAPDKPLSNPYSEPFDDGYSNQPAYNAPAPYSNQSSYGNMSQYGSQAPYNCPQSFNSPSPYSSQPPFKGEPAYSNQAFKSDDIFDEETPYGYGQYNAPIGQYKAPVSGGQYNVPGNPYNIPGGQPSRPHMYPPRGGFGDFNRKPVGGPMRGSVTSFGRGATRYGMQPY